MPDYDGKYFDTSAWVQPSMWARMSKILSGSCLSRKSDLTVHKSCPAGWSHDHEFLELLAVLALPK